jgi:hypothetical protein
MEKLVLLMLFEKAFVGGRTKSDLKVDLAACKPFSLRHSSEYRKYHHRTKEGMLGVGINGLLHKSQKDKVVSSRTLRLNYQGRAAASLSGTSHKVSCIKW